MWNSFLNVYLPSVYLLWWGLFRSLTHFLWIVYYCWVSGILCIYWTTKSCVGGGRLPPLDCVLHRLSFKTYSSPVFSYFLHCWKVLALPKVTCVFSWVSSVNLRVLHFRPVIDFELLFTRRVSSASGWSSTCSSAICCQKRLCSIVGFPPYVSDCVRVASSVLLARVSVPPLPHCVHTGVL